MKTLRQLVNCLSLFSLNIVFAQDISADSLLHDLSAETEEIKLLPDKMLLTQRIFWGKNGLYRKVGIAPELTAENRQKELRTRRTMFKIHQAVGFATAAGMLLQGVLGTRLYNFDFTNKSFSEFEKIEKTHKAVATGINIAYTTTALMAFTAPPAQIRRKGVSNIEVHKALSYIHLSGMITTNILSKKIDKNPDLKPYHRASAFTTFGAFAGAIAIIKFEF